MRSVQKNDLVEPIGLFIENDFLFSEYYAECSRSFADKAGNFEKLAQHEKVHASAFLL
ncbi:MAG: hypothetical protein ACD_47C00145G0003 [uncultured bacterium]|nr:MAG: hypothetical protein ACD_47C00145G0003 [uncultured bacterium]